MTREQEIMKYIEDFEKECKALYDINVVVKIKDVPNAYKFNLNHFVQSVNDIIENDRNVPKYARKNGLTNKMRCRQLVLYRQSMSIILKEKHFKLREIAEVLNYNCHATVIHGIKTLTDLINMNNVEAIEIHNTLLHELKENYYTESHPSRN